MSLNNSNNRRPSGSGRSSGRRTTIGTGSTYKREQAIKVRRIAAARKYGPIVIAAIVVIVLIIIIVSASALKDLSNLAIESTASTQTLSFSGASKNFSYDIYRSENSGEYTLLTTISDGSSSITFDNLDAGTKYSYKITASDGNKTTEGVSIEAYTIPDAPVDAAAQTLSAESLNISWRSSGHAEAYEIKYGLYEDLSDAITISVAFADTSYNDETGTRSCTLEDLVVSETYYMSIRAVCADAASQWCSTFSGTVTKAIDMSGIDTSLPMVALTFDDGPDEDGVTERILEILNEYDAHATFFEIGSRAEENPELILSMVNSGQEIGNHSYSDIESSDELTKEDIVKCSDVIENICDVRPTLFRTPGGGYNDEIIETCEEEDMAVILWNFDTMDWSTLNQYDTIYAVETYTEDGDIIQFHSTYDETADAIEVIVPWLIDQGYQLVTVSQLIQARVGNPPAEGTVYRSAYSYE